MKITSGEAKGQKLRTPKSMDIRPTTSRLRGSIFSILNSMNIPLDNMLDLFAGTGSVGIEALSRGAEFVDFVEHSAKLSLMMKENLSRLKFEDRGKVFCCSASKALGFLTKQYSVIFLDPPYSFSSTSSMLSLIASKPLSTGSVLVVQHPSQTELLHRYNKFIIVKQRRYGDANLTIYREEEY